jgi:hypothetical protein
LSWLALILGGLAIAGAYILLSEWALSAKGIQITVQDDEVRWQSERERARTLGRQALILVGASRVQLDIDIRTLRESTNLEPVQLAIDGSSSLPILKGLADDPAINGTVMVGIQFTDFNVPRKDDGYLYQSHFEQGSYRQALNYKVVETWLQRLRRDHLRNYSDGARPWDSFWYRLIPDTPTKQYLVTYPDRSRAADYNLVSMPKFYLARVQRNLNQQVEIPAGASMEQVETMLEQRVHTLGPVDNASFLAQLPMLEADAHRIQERGGKVIYVVMPVSGLIKEMDDRRYPISQYWDHLAAIRYASTINFEDQSDMAAFSCPDGSHLDKRDRQLFTKALAAHLLPIIAASQHHLD